MRLIPLARSAAQSPGYGYYKENRVGKLNKFNIINNSNIYCYK